MKDVLTTQVNPDSNAVEGTFDYLFEQLSSDNKTKGTQFEHITKWYLQNDPFYAHELKNVWLWKEWTDAWKENEAGIDLVAEHISGELWAIQSKAYAETTSVSMHDMSQFLSESATVDKNGKQRFAFRLLVATTDLMSFNAGDVSDGSLIPVGIVRRADLDAAQLIWPASPADLRAPKPEPKSPLPHQVEAITDVVTGFQDHDRGQLISAPGTGKSLTGLFIKEKFASERTLVTVPSISLLGQFLREWMANKTADFAVLPVCSDETVNNDDEIPVSKVSSLGMPARTDPEQIAEFLREKGPRVVFSTYHSTPEIAAALKLADVPGFDLVIADEAHRTAGRGDRPTFRTVLDNEKILATKRLFMTATPKTYTQRILDAGIEANFEYVSMDDEDKYGPVFHELPLGKAIEDGLLADYRVLIVGVTDDMYCEWAERGKLIKFVTVDGQEIRDARTVASQVALTKAMKNYDLRRVITFNSRINASAEFANLFPQVIDWMPEDERPSGQVHAEHVSGEDSADKRKRALQRLRNLHEGERRVLANARCLTEGIDVPALDAVMFIDPKRSKIDIVQACGRAIRRDPANPEKVGTIIIPVFLDVNENHELAVEQSAFKQVYDVLLEMRAIDKRLAEEIDGIRREIGPLATGYKKPVGLPKAIEVDIPETHFEEFSCAFNARLIEMTSVSWQGWFGLLEQFVELYGDAHIPARFKTKDGYPLGSWVNIQRTAYQHKESWLTEERISQLETLTGWTWDLHDHLFQTGLDHLVEYAKNHAGDYSPPLKYVAEDGYRLGGWVNTIRSRRGKLSDDRIHQLEELSGWVWNPRDARFKVGLNHLQDYVKKNGDARVANTYVAEDGYNLGNWTNSQRYFYKKGDNRLSLERISQLEELPGWEWAPKFGPQKQVAEAWDKHYDQLLQYFAQYGEIPKIGDWWEDFHLGKWVSEQRSKYGKGDLSSDRVHRLEELTDWKWSLGKDWRGKS